jgi:hypothetical protein
MRPSGLTPDIDRLEQADQLIPFTQRGRRRGRMGYGEGIHVALGAAGDMPDIEVVHLACAGLERECTNY